MRTTFAAIGAALILATSVQFAAAGQRHQGKTDRMTVTQQQQQIRNRNAFAAWPSAAPETYGYRSSAYSGGYSAPAGR